MGQLRFAITKPTTGTTVGRRVTVAVDAGMQGTGFPTFDVTAIDVDFGDGAPMPAAIDPATHRWTCTGHPPTAVPGGSPVTITAILTGTRTTVDQQGADHTKALDPPPRKSVTVTLAPDSPDGVVIDAFASPVTPQSLPYRLTLTGTANDTANGIIALQLRVDDQPFTDVPHEDRFGVWFWTKELSFDPGGYAITVRAVDGAGNRHEATTHLSVEQPFQPGPVDQVFTPGRYLVESLAFARRYVKVDGTAGTLTAPMLAARCGQPFDRLTDPALFTEATRPIPKARIAVEAVRSRFTTPVPDELDQRFRGLAYQAFLRGIGTSYDELRLARTAEPPAREALAARLRLGQAARLDQLTVPPTTITDEQLEDLTGYRSTAAGRPLPSAPGGSKVLLWRRDALRAAWQRDDGAARDAAGVPRPIIDPDRVPAGGLRNADGTDPAFAIRQARATWVVDTLARIEHALRIGADPLARFDAAVAVSVGTIDLAALAAKDADGTDVGPDIGATGLVRDAFRFLARTRALLARGVQLDTEWDDAAAILLQARKRTQFPAWQREESHAGVVLEPATFLPDAPRTPLPRWRAGRADDVAWRTTLTSRAAAAAALENDHRNTLAEVEAAVLPQLRDALIAELAVPGETPDAAADRLSRELMIDLRAGGTLSTTRVDQALETLRTVLFSARAASLGPDGGGRAWTVDVKPGGNLDFDREWDWMGSFPAWLSASRVFAYPDNQLFPALYVDGQPGLEPPSAAYLTLIDTLRRQARITPEDARTLAAAYLQEVRAAAGLDPQFVLTEQLSDNDLLDRQKLSASLFPDPPGQPEPHQREIFWLVPMAVAGKLQESGQFQAALDWYRTVFAYHLPAENRRIFHAMTVEGRPGFASTYDREPEWLIDQLNPHLFALKRRNCSTRATIMALVGCFNAFGDAEFAADTPDGNARARTLYETAVSLLDLPEAQPETGDDVPFPANPVWTALRDHSTAGLAKIHQGLNIAGAAAVGPGAGDETVQPSQYRYGALAERAKNLVAIAQQVEASYLSTLEQRDAKAYDELRARNDLDVARATVDIHTTKLAEAVTGVRAAELQRRRAQLQEDHFSQLIDAGRNTYEKAELAAMGVAMYLQAAAGVAGAIGGTLSAAFTLGVLGGSSSVAQSLSSFAAASSTGAQIAGALGSFERRKEDWQLQRDLAAQDGEIADKQVQAAEFGLQLAGQERQLAVLQQDHATAVATFLATRFTNAELFEWMSGVLGRVYAFVLQQATALARLAEAQLAFERQELPAGFVGADYWRDATSGAPDRRGLTGSARLLEDVTRLDQYAFDTDRRKLHLTQTIPLSQLAAFELQQFRETGVLAFATPEILFDREFPGHYLRLVKRVKVSLVALLPPVRGVRATLSASGVSRTVVARGPFETVTLRRDPEAIAFTSPVNATGLFDLEPEGGLLLPFEGMGVDTVWRLELPKAANPFDFRSIADVLLTVEYTALESAEYRERVVRELDRRFSGDRTFSVRNDFPDAWFDLHNPDTVDPDQRMRVNLPITADDLPPHIQDLHVEQISLFAVRADPLTDELTVTSLRHGQTVSTGPVTTTGGIISTRRPAGEPWNVHLRADPAGTWEIQLPDEEVVRSWFRDELVDDLVLVFTLGGTTPEWP